MNKSISQLAVGFLPCLIRFLMDKGPLLPKCSWEARRSLPWAHWKYLAEDASCLLENSTRVVGLDIDRHSWGPSNQSISLRSRTTGLLIERERTPVLCSS
ncbi:unnamed protein product, partial [Musa hybrid cultivar]